jgi:hypothetical protein
MLSGVRRAVIALPLVLAAAPAAAAEPYSFIVAPTDQIGVPGHAEGTEITPEGYLYTGHGEFVFRLGPRHRPWNEPSRTLEGGRYPIVRSAARSGGLTYSLTTFAATVAGQPVDFVRVTIRNKGRRSARLGWDIGARYTGGERKANGVRRFRFARPVTPARPGLYYQPGEPFDPSLRHRFAGPALVRGDRALYFMGPTPHGIRRSLHRGRRHPAQTQVVGVARYRGRLSPGRSVRLDFRIPVTPVARGGAHFTQIAQAGFDAYHARALRFWRGVLGRVMDVSVPERKVVDTFYASVMNAALARYKSGDHWVQTVNDLQYHAFWLRDGAAIASMFDLVGLHDLARQDLDFFLTWQQADGLFTSRPDQYDGFGQALWAFGEHVRRTGDDGFARGVLPAVGRAMDWLERARAADPMGLLPPSTPRDNELVAGHLAGDNLWGVAGARSAAGIARAAGEAGLADRYAAQTAAYQATLDAQIRQAVKRTGGWIPPALDADGGQDWGNLWPAYPTRIYPATDDAVEATMRRARSRFQEGIATYLDGRLLHAYLGFRVFQTDLARGSQERAVEGLYSELAHTTSTHGGFETGVRVYGSRAVDDNMTPHGWFAAEYATLLRNMLVREDDDGLVLMSALSPAWLEPGEAVSVHDAPTTFGPVDFTLRARDHGARLEWHANVPEGTRIRWPLPDWASAIQADNLTKDGRTVVLPDRSGTLDVRWRLNAPAASYSRTVSELQAAYRRRGR